MNIRSQSVLIFIISFLLFVNFSYTAKDVNIVKRIIPQLFKVKKVEGNKLILEVKWDGTGIKDHEKVTTKLHGCKPSGTLTFRKDKKKHKFSDRETTYELAVHEKKVPVQCLLEFTGNLQTNVTFGFQT
ncbi:hypothetical protein RhiirA5_401637 [Rhizophagus irregularis]|uniref:Uncharacterized protein n=3 Tax=Rhizophagus irregularis TaxID=588596 RepID=A0A2I1GKL4_9GLOM|nr:hypothetical protein GLOIN_2v1145893 [Rhizophagus irregularis DAOM 181602=DAOM 197198]EXX68580.1 hypothetical protein RirG_103870 [Rhizophagus irregularis DAOM 197198w]PKC04063.1 hypothetical protein RhiirA5_401637 [Rhizophagus irregularis]PKC59282.1 hypothetical protein RhiirA1_540586 [Rhizophagus irregularis]PKK76392.1 hypothetical protein RhiirC2_862627 [Rhizophagus irregularis]PKY18843.1 hypothetical protein RhiirB3_468805 [Rhizophagus irregularis]|eukprot:XP_025179700.1 hypothetical protein GLOIN_2v1145893 [Rhizophagus irregularis DAOM 181602=DAOM 197198]